MMVAAQDKEAHGECEKDDAIRPVFAAFCRHIVHGFEVVGQYLHGLNASAAVEYAAVDEVHRGHFAGR